MNKIILIAVLFAAILLGFSSSKDNKQQPLFPEQSLAEAKDELNKHPAITQAKDQLEPEKTTEPQDTEPAKKLGISLSSWVKQMNIELKKSKLKELKVNKKLDNCGEQCTRVYDSGKHIAYLVSYKGDEINEILCTLTSDGSFESNANVLIEGAILAAVLSPTADKEERSGKILKILGDSISENDNKNVTIGKIKYSSTFIKDMGLFLTATPI